jgi:hypothetical protein
MLHKRKVHEYRETAPLSEETLAQPLPLAVPGLHLSGKSAPSAHGCTWYLRRGGELGGEREGVVHRGVGQVVVQVLHGALAGHDGLEAGAQRGRDMRNIEHSEDGSRACAAVLTQIEYAVLACNSD